MSRPIQAFVLVMLGSVLIRLAVTGDYLNYVRPGLGPFLIAAGAFLAALGVAGILRDIRRGADPGLAGARRRASARRRTHGPGAKRTHHDHEHDDWYGHSTGWLLCVPLFVLLVLPPPALGSYAAGRSGAAAPAPTGRGYSALTTDPARLTVRDYAMRAVWDKGRSLSGRTVVLTGFVAASPGDLWYLTRLHIVCCAADATPAKVEVLGSAVRYSTGQWVEVTGTWTPSDPSDLGGTVARVRAAGVTVVPRPADPYE